MIFLTSSSIYENQQKHDEYSYKTMSSYDICKLCNYEHSRFINSKRFNSILEKDPSFKELKMHDWIVKKGINSWGKMKVYLFSEKQSYVIIGLLNPLLIIKLYDERKQLKEVSDKETEILKLKGEIVKLKNRLSNQATEILKLKGEIVKLKNRLSNQATDNFNTISKLLTNELDFVFVDEDLWRSIERNFKKCRKDVFKASAAYLSRLIDISSSISSKDELLTIKQGMELHFNEDVKTHELNKELYDVGILYKDENQRWKLNPEYKEYGEVVGGSIKFYSSKFKQLTEIMKILKANKKGNTYLTVVK